MMENRRLYEEVLASIRKAAGRPGGLNAKDLDLLAVDEPDPKTIGSLLFKMRKRGALRPTDLTDLRLAVKRWGWGKQAFGHDFELALAETWMENEIKKETPKNV